eukprot:978786-Pleurochrysis_carterae.AAC.1
MRLRRVECPFLHHGPEELVSTAVRLSAVNGGSSAPRFQTAGINAKETTSREVNYDTLIRRIYVAGESGEVLLIDRLTN